jgi:hypothetical protein
VLGANLIWSHARGTLVPYPAWFAYAKLSGKERTVPSNAATGESDTSCDMANVVSGVPVSFDVQPFARKWFRWAEVAACFWPGRGRRAHQVNPELAPVRMVGGVYGFAWSSETPPVLVPTGASVRYIGQSNEFRRRMGNFADSAGFWGPRSKGHSAGWRWPLGKSEKLWVAFYPIGNDLRHHLAVGMRCWMEAVALEEFRLVHGRLPKINDATSDFADFET